jgi:enoyl-[acyl-carrier protein] reductase II
VLIPSLPSLLPSLPFPQTAKSAKASGADALLVTGHEAAAHGGDVTSLVLVPAIASKVPELPLIAAGGFGDGRGLLAALSLGADAVAMGTRFACTEESPLHENVKKVIVSEGQTESSTVYSKNIDGIWARVMKTPFAAEAAGKRANPLVVLIEALKQAKRFGVNPLKVLPGLFMEPDKIYMLAQFGGATRKFELATVSAVYCAGVVWWWGGGWREKEGSWHATVCASAFIPREEVLSRGRVSLGK